MLPELLPALSRQGRFEKLRTLSSSSAYEAYEMLRTQILLLMLRGGYRTLAVTSPTPGAGTSTVAANVAVALSREFDFTTILVDANLRHPSLRRMLNLPPGPVFADYLAGTAEPEQLLVKWRVAGCSSCPAVSPSTAVPSSPFGCDGRACARTSRRAPGSADRVRPAAGARRSRHARVLPHVDAVLLVIEEGVTTQEELERAHEILAEAHVLGIVPCKSREAARLRRGRDGRKAGSGRRAQRIGMLEARFNEISPPAEETQAELGRTTNSRTMRRSRIVLSFVVLLAALAGLSMLAFAEGWSPPNRAAELLSELGDRVAELLSELGR